ncbi:MAG: endo alpha-1,4 polygalactosaminidase [Phycisphaerae bacterium]|nr:endo alpha-1,4 polygalactosaminidase [Phycisphaerae bacterium]
MNTMNASGSAPGAARGGLRRGLRLCAFAFTALLLAASAGCTTGDGGGGGDDANDNNANLNDNDNDNATGESFLYVLQPDAVGDAALAVASFDWLVLEPSREGDAASEFTRAELNAIRQGGACGDKIILAYLSIGEAEDYREYWDSDWVNGSGTPIDGVAPSWLGPSNPDWGGNYKVRYWDPDWQAIILGTASGPEKTPLDRIIDAGFDGVYLDIVDAFEFWSDPDEGIEELSRQEARERMIEWVTRIAEYARDTRGVEGFLVFPQNADEIIYNDDDALDALSEDYFSVVDGIGIEDLVYSGTDPNDEEDVTRRLATLAEFTDRGKTVLVTDYVLNANYTPANSGSRAADFVARARQAGLIPYAAVEEGDLDEVVVLGSGWPVAQPIACEP